MTESTHRLGFAGTPELAATVLNSLLGSELGNIEIVYTQPDRPAGRGRKLKKSPVKEIAEAHHLPLSQPRKAGEFDKGSLQQLDVLVVAAYGMLLPAELLNLPKYGCINIHTSLLPRWRGAAPIQRAIEAGDRETGITIMQMDTGLDTGDILLQRSCPIHDSDTAGLLHDRLAQLGAECLLETLPRLFAGKLKPRHQDDGQATYANKISKDEARIDWSRPAQEIERCIRAFNPTPVAHTELNGIAMRIWEAEIIDGQSDVTQAGHVVACDPDGITVTTGKQQLRIHRLQLPGKKVYTVQDFLNGHPSFMATPP